MLFKTDKWLSTANLLTVALGFVEGMDNKIRTLQKRAYGYRAEEYLRLKILACLLPKL